MADTSEIRTQPSPRIPRQALWPVVACSALVALTRALTRSRTPFEWDSVNFALALDQLDLAQHQPHPPAAIGYVVVARALRAAFADANTALVAWNVLLTLAAAVLVFAFAYHASSRDRERHGWLAWTTLVASPLFWLYGSVAEIYLSETTLALLVAYCCCRALDGSRAHGYAAGAALAGLGAFRLTGMLFLLPLVAFTAWRARVPLARLALAFAAGLALWLAPFLYVEGPATYLRLLGDQGAQQAATTSVLAASALRQLNRHLRDLCYALLIAIGPWNVVGLGAVLALRRPALRPRGELPALAALWTLPALAFYSLVHMAKFGYALPALPAAALALAFYYGQVHGRALRLLLVGGQLVFGTCFFLLARPATGSAIGEGLRYRDKSVLQKVATETNALAFASRHTIVERDEQLLRVVSEVERACPAGEGALVVARDGPGANWRRLMYELPRATTLRVPSDPGAPWFIARGRRFAVRDQPAIELAEGCRTFWVLPDGAPALRQLAETGALRPTQAGVGWSEGERRVSVLEERSLRITRAAE